MDIVEEIKARLSIEHVVSEYVDLQKSGRTLKARCPFHDERSPSFIVTPEKGLAYCFGCHTGGDIFEFIQKIEQVDFRESIKILAKKAGIEAMLSEEEAAKFTAKTPLFDLHEALTQFYMEVWMRPQSKHAQEYIAKRGLADETRLKFRIGLAPEGWEEATQYLLQKGFSEQDLLQSGAFIRNDETGKLHDRFRNRLMFPITNAQGTVIAFSGRSLDQNEQAKYVNSAESPLFSKKHALFGIQFARSMIRSLKYTILVEGQFDVVLLHQVGICNAVATSGTACTLEHMHVLSRMAPNVVFAFDHDTAGLQATKKALEIALSKDLNCRIVRLPAKNDPADIIQKQGKDFFVQLLQTAENPYDFLLNTFSVAEERGTLVGKKNILEIFAPLYAQLTSPIAEAEMIQYLELHAKIREDDIRAEFKKKKFHQKTSEPQGKKTELKTSLIEYILAFASRYPQCFHMEDCEKILLLLLDKEWSSVYRTLKDTYNDAGSEKFVHASLDHPDILKTQIIKLGVFLDEQYPFDLPDEAIRTEYEQLVTRLKEQYKRFRLRQITLDMKIAEMNQDGPEIQRLQEEQMKLFTL